MADYLLVIVEDKPFTLWSLHGFIRMHTNYNKLCQIKVPLPLFGAPFLQNS